MPKRKKMDERVSRHQALPIPTNLQVETASSSMVSLRWDISVDSGDVNAEGCIIEWSRDGEEFVPTDEILLSRQTKRIQMAFTDNLPTSGVSWYRIRSFLNKDGDLITSRASEMVKITIPAPAAGDV